MGTVVFVFIFILGIVFVIMHFKPEDKSYLNDMKYFGVKDKGYHVSVWPLDKSSWECIEFYIAGVAYRQHIDRYLGEFEGRLVADPDNPYDSNSIKILAKDGHHVGFVPKDRTSEIHNNKKLPCKCYCFIGKQKDKDGEHYYTDCYVDYD